MNIINDILQYLSDFWDRMFWICIGGVVQVFFINRTKERQEKKLTKWGAFGIWLTAIFIGAMTSKLAILAGHINAAGVLAAISTVFSISVITAINDIIPDVLKSLKDFLVNKYTKK